MEEEHPMEVPVDGVLDLHTFRPAEVKAVVLAYIEACEEKGIRDLRIIHGKGVGILRQQVHALLDRHALVLSYELAPATAGGWGATLVRLRA
ncbi:MAG TPA: Smr/MutS family protein [Oceanipulchritudo sp.]|nr:Smr/MutS family protein [Oceanipulchritudo sp.]